MSGGGQSERNKQSPEWTCVCVCEGLRVGWGGGVGRNPLTLRDKHGADEKDEEDGDTS